MTKEKSFFLYIYLKLRLNTVKHNTKVPNLSRKVHDFLLIPSCFFHTPPHFLGTADRHALSALKRERKNAMNHHIWVLQRHEIAKRRKKPLLAYRKTRIIYPKMGIAVSRESL